MVAKLAISPTRLCEVGAYSAPHGVWFVRAAYARPAQRGRRLSSFTTNEGREMPTSTHTNFTLPATQLALLPVDRLTVVETIAKLLASEGWQILARNIETRWGVLSLVVRHRATIAFVTTETVKFDDKLPPLLERANNRVRRSAVSWMAMNPARQERVITYRFDRSVAHIASDGAINGITIVEGAF